MVVMIEVNGLTKVYGSTVAVDDLTFTVKPGVVTGFLGPNGAGKSTTMRMILGLDKPTNGYATINGQPYYKLKNPLRTVGALLDAKAVHRKRSAYAHLSWIADSNGIPRSRVNEALDLVGLSEVAKRPAGKFSLGMGQRLGLAAAMLGDPEVLLFDEPVNGLDPEGIRWVRGFLRNLAAEGRTVLVSSHLLSEMSQTADRLVVIGQGKLVADTTTHEFLKRSSKVSVRVRSPRLEEFRSALALKSIPFTDGTDEDERPYVLVKDKNSDEVGEVAFAAGVPLGELTEVHDSLEDVFMQATSDSVQYHGEASAAAKPKPSQHALNEKEQ
ncbi:ABC transporter, ATP-binding protein [Corynebacterium glucuronolyticum ATCC 51867]|nr:ABC transporter, ATP-binding protein [Corynebacterium glucuronolyticum ATCC 51867]